MLDARPSGYLVLGLGLSVKRKETVQQLFLVACVVLGFGIVAFEYDLLRDWDTSGESQKIRVQGVFVLGAVLMIGLLAFTWRRMQDYKAEVARRLAAEADAHQAARHDQLTGLPNRKLFAERAGEAMGRAWANGSNCAVMFIDLDGFKPVNDTHGHKIGDALLVKIAERLQESVMGLGAIVARVGGDEFAALVEFDNGKDVPELMARRILREIQRPIAVDRKDINVSAAIGVAIGPTHGRRADDLIHAADLAMYEAKRAGRGVVKVYEAGEQPTKHSSVA
jgi:diguanylate cyclase (GGDEF)-like protein